MIPSPVALQLAGRAVSTRGTLPSLGGILVIAADGSLTLRATDMELALTSTLTDAKTEQPGSVLLPGRLFADVVRSLPPGEVTLELRSEQRDVEIAAGGARFHLRTLPADDFPRLPEIEGETRQAARRRRWARRSTSSLAPPRATRCARFSPACSSRPRATG